MRRISYIVCILFLVSCIKEIPYKPGEKAANSPVIHCFMVPDSILEADVSKVSGMLDNTTLVPDADIELYINSVFSQKLNYISGTKFQGAMNTMKANDSFALKITGFNKPILIAGKVPNKIVVDDLDTSTIILPGIGKSFNFQIKFKDSAAYENYYRLYVVKTAWSYTYDNAGNLTDSVLRWNLLPIEGRELAFIRNNFNNYSKREILFSDEIINGVYNTFNFYTTENLKKSKQSRPLKLEIYLENIPKELYDFYNTRNAHIWQQQSITQIPGLVQGNVPGGYGVVAAITLEKRSIQLP